MNRWQSFEYLCAELRAGLLAAERPTPPSYVTWELVIEASSYHLVTPALAWCLRSDSTVPIEAGNYLATFFALNSERNEILLNVLERVLRALNAIDIVPVLLKGSAILAEELLPNPSLRVLRDIDLLVPPDLASRAARALEGIGFAPDRSQLSLESDYHHLPALYDPLTSASVEIHTRITNSLYLPLIPPGYFEGEARPFRFRELNARLPGPTGAVAHCVAHGPIMDGSYWRSNVSLRQLIDLAVIRARHEDDIDWDEIDRRFGASWFGRALRTNLLYAEYFFGQPSPKLRHTPPPKAIALLRRTIQRPGRQRWGKLFNSLLVHAMRIRERPSRITAVLKPQYYADHLRRLTQSFQARKW